MFQILIRNKFIFREDQKQTKGKISYKDISKHTLRAAYSAFTHSNTHTHTHICNE